MIHPACEHEGIFSSDLLTRGGRTGRRRLHVRCAITAGSQGNVHMHTQIHPSGLSVAGTL